MVRRHYETVVIVNAALEDNQVDDTIARIEDSIKTNGGEINESEKWGRKRLAYPIQKSKSGYYAVYRYTAPSASISTIERNLKLDETVIRFLTVMLDKKALEHYEKLEKQKVKEAKIAAEEKAAEVKAEENATEKTESEDTTNNN